MRFAIMCVVLGIVMIIFGANMEDTNTMKPFNKPCFYTQATALNVRQSPNKESQILQTLPRGKQICVYGEVENGFLHTEFGYIAVQYLSLNPSMQHNIKSQLHRDSTKPTQPKIMLTSTEKATKHNVEFQSILHQARMAMEAQNYMQAKNLALQINAKNPKNIESWEIFTKALYLEGNKQEAMLILENFLLKHHNDALFRLLEQMQGDKI